MMTLVLTARERVLTLTATCVSPKGQLMNEQTIARTDTAVAPVLLTPTLVEKMLASREAVQVIKFRTTCTDCVPNY